MVLWIEPSIPSIIDFESAVFWDQARLNGWEICSKHFRRGIFIGKVDRPDAGSSPNIKCSLYTCQPGRDQLARDWCLLGYLFLWEQGVIFLQTVWGIYGGYKSVGSTVCYGNLTLCRGFRSVCRRLEPLGKWVLVIYYLRRNTHSRLLLWNYDNVVHFQFCMP